MSRPVRALVMATIAVVALAGPATASRKSDQKLANRAVLSVEDVPAGFTDVPLPDSDSSEHPDACGGDIAAAGDLVTAAPVKSAGFQLDPDQGYAIIFNEVAVLNKASKAKRVIKAHRDEGAMEPCIQAIIEGFLAEENVVIESTFSSFSPELDDKGSTKVVKGGNEYAGYSGSVRRSVAGGQPQFFEATVVFGRVGRAVFELRFVTTGTAPTDDVQAMMQAVVTRLKRAK